MVTPSNPYTTYPHCSMHRCNYDVWPIDPITIDPLTNPFWDNQGDISKLSAFSGSSEILLMPNIRMRVGATFPRRGETEITKNNGSKCLPPKQNVLKHVLCWGGLFMFSRYLEDFRKRLIRCLFWGPCDFLWVFSHLGSSAFQCLNSGKPTAKIQSIHWLGIFIYLC